ncbi:hypothetical protein K431DRAFT_21191 [Polychaeton citri CBS 116435]|uniref:N-acetyltransferase domain-containing protein n=1 Tax=Polychaeton citri CBS 116435 TaxID=1314669 RepID=A0A9P4UK12_9PEZI|nr:hypothetical protein K431DRAFT_21191 [Polychaeton citri CBS 116435]
MIKRSNAIRILTSPLSYVCVATVPSRPGGSENSHFRNRTRTLHCTLHCAADQLTQPSTVAAAMNVSDTQITIIPGASLPAQPCWQDLHRVIETSFRNQDIRAFPASWHRLHPNPEVAGPKLAKELGPHGQLGIVFKNDKPVACGGVVPFRGENWVNEAKDAGAAAENADGRVVELDTMPERPSAPHPSLDTSGHSRDWEICCFCVHPDHRRQGLGELLLQRLISFVLERDAARLFAGFSIEESGDYWPKMAFSTIPGAGGTLKRGFKHEPDMEGLEEDLRFGMGVRVLRV